MSITKKLKLRLKSALRTHREFDEFIDFMIEALSGGGGSGGGQQIEYHTLTAGNISSKSLLLNFEPASASSIEVTIQGGPDQFYNIDFGLNLLIVFLFHFLLVFLLLLLPHLVL